MSFSFILYGPLRTQSLPHSLYSPTSGNLYTSNSMLGVILPNPSLNKLAELFGLPEKILCLRLGSGVRAVIINKISLAPTGIEISGQRGDRRTDCNLDGLEGCLVMPRTNNPIASTGNHDLAQLENGVVSGRKPSVCRKSRHRRIL